VEIALYVVIAIGIVSSVIFVFARSSAKQIPVQEPADSQSKTPEIVAEQQSAVAPTPVISDNQRFLAGLKRSRGVLAKSLQKIFGGGVDEDVLEELEEALLMADVGVHTSMSLVDKLRESGRKVKEPGELQEILRAELMSLLGQSEPLQISEAKPHVILMIGVNGSGKTTTIGKLAHRLIQEGKSVMVAAGDTFRAGAIEQLEVWAERSGAQFISASPGADPASVIHNALTAAKARDVDVVLCDTAGRLQAQQALMAELGKVVKVSQKLIPEAPHETLLVLDATIGQNALSQAEGFTKVAPITGVVLTKLDGTAKGGVVLAVRKELGIPVRLVGLGEGKNDLRDFNAELFVNALLDQNKSEEEA